MVIFAIVLGAGLGFGITLWIIAAAVNKSNNIGDSTGGFANYGSDIQYSVKRDKIGMKEKQIFMENGGN